MCVINNETERRNSVDKRTSMIRPTVVIVPLVAVVAEMCEDPAIRADIHTILMWQRVFMFVVGAGVLAIYRQYATLPPSTLAKWLAAYVTSYFLIAEVTHHLA